MSKITEKEKAEWFDRQVQEKQKILEFYRVFTPQYVEEAEKDLAIAESIQSLLHFEAMMVSQINQQILDAPDGEIICDGLLTADELRRLQEAVRRDGQIDESEAEKIVRWASRIFSQYETVKLLLEGWARVEGFSGDAPNLVPTRETVEFIGTADLDAMMPEEMRCSVS